MHEKNARRIGAAFKCGTLTPDVFGEACVYRKPLACEANRWLQALLEGQAAELLRKVRPCSHFAGNSGRECGIGRSARHRLAIGIEKHVARGRSGRDFARIDEQVEAVAGTMQHVETAAAQSGTARFRDFQGCAHGHGSVKCVAAGCQDLKSRFARERICAGYRRDWRFAGFVGERPLRQEQQREQAGNPKAARSVRVVTLHATPRNGPCGSRGAS